MGLNSSVPYLFLYRYFNGQHVRNLFNIDGNFESCILTFRFGIEVLCNANSGYCLIAVYHVKEIIIDTLESHFEMLRSFIQWNISLLSNYISLLYTQFDGIYPHSVRL